MAWIAGGTLYFAEGANDAIPTFDEFAAGLHVVSRDRWLEFAGAAVQRSFG